MTTRKGGAVDAVLMRDLESMTAAYYGLGRRFAAAHGLHPTDVEALFHLMRADEDGVAVAAGDLQRALGVASGTLTAVVDRLERAGHVRREPDATDRRRVRVRLTPSATQAGREYWAAVDGRVRARLRGYTAAELATVRRFLADLTAAATDEDGTGP